MALLTTLWAYEYLAPVPEIYPVVFENSLTRASSASVTSFSLSFVAA